MGLWNLNPRMWLHLQKKNIYWYTESKISFLDILFCLIWGVWISSFYPYWRVTKNWMCWHYTFKGIQRITIIKVKWQMPPLIFFEVFFRYSVEKQFWKTFFFKYLRASLWNTEPTKYIFFIGICHICQSLPFYAWRVVLNTFDFLLLFGGKFVEPKCAKVNKLNKVTNYFR